MSPSSDEKFWANLSSYDDVTRKGYAMNSFYESSSQPDSEVWNRNLYK